ncbi:protein of unknown function (plasmid) [Ralstonia solanacearum PSI07]|nr:protein of unknown function [Ralstonia solanacearum PSI07]
MAARAVGQRLLRSGRQRPLAGHRLGTRGDRIRRPELGRPSPAARRHPGAADLRRRRHRPSAGHPAAAQRAGRAALARRRCAARAGAVRLAFAEPGRRRLQPMGGRRSPRPAAHAAGQLGRQQPAQPRLRGLARPDRRRARRVARHRRGAAHRRVGRGAGRWRPAAVHHGTGAGGRHAARCEGSARPVHRRPAHRAAPVRCGSQPAGAAAGGQRGVRPAHAGARSGPGRPLPEPRQRPGRHPARQPITGRQVRPAAAGSGIAHQPRPGLAGHDHGLCGATPARHGPGRLAPGRRQRSGGRRGQGREPVCAAQRHPRHRRGRVGIDPGAYRCAGRDGGSSGDGDLVHGVGGDPRAAEHRAAGWGFGDPDGGACHHLRDAEAVGEGGGASVDWAGGGQPFRLDGLPDSRVKLFEQQIRAIDERTGDPIAHLPYKIVTEGGDVHYGTTDIEGKTIRVPTIKSEKVTVFWGKSPPYNS